MAVILLAAAATAVIRLPLLMAAGMERCRAAAEGPEGPFGRIMVAVDGLRDQNDRIIAMLEGARSS
jgi:hypothetical protein